MVSKELHHAARITRKANIPEEDRTSGRDEVADWIEQNAADNWHEWTFQDVAEEIGCSRQHVANTVSAYFTPDDGRQEPTAKSDTDDIQLDRVPEDGEVPDWVIEKVKDAYRDGMQDGIEIGKGL